MSRWTFIVLLCLFSAVSHAGSVGAVLCKKVLSPSSLQAAVESTPVSSSNSVDKKGYLSISSWFKGIHDYFTDKKTSREENKSIPTPAPQPQSTAGSWIPDFSTVRGRVNLLISILQRHPNFVSLNVAFRRNILETFSRIPEVLALLGKNAQSLEIGPPQVLSAKYYASEVRFDANKLQSFRENLKKDLSAVSLIPGGKFIDQVKSLKGKDKATEALFHLLPFLFDTKGNALFQSWDLTEQTTFAQKIQNSGPAVWENGYFDLLNEGADKQIAELAKQPKYQESVQWYIAFKNQFVAKMVKLIIQPIKATEGEENSLSLRELSIESVPAGIAPGRGNFGGDCSIKTVPYYSLLKGVTVHYIRKSADLTKKPDGYVLSVKVKEGDQFIPYFLTVNGATLTKADIEATVNLVLQSNPDYKSKRVAFPDWKITPDLVNWQVAKQALSLPNGHKGVIQFPDGWEALAEYQNKNITGFTNYYSAASLKQPYIGEFSPSIQMFGEVEKPLQLSAMYLQPRQIEQIPKIERAFIAAQAWQRNQTLENKQVLQILDVTDLQRQAVIPLMAVSPRQGLSFKEYRALQAQFNDFTLKNILALELKSRGKALSSLYEESLDLFKEHKARGNAKVKETLISYYGGEMHGPLIEYLWDLRDFSDADLLNFFKSQVQEVGSNHFESYLAIDKFIFNSSHGAATEVRDFLAQTYLQSVGNDASLGRDLYTMQNSKDTEVQSFKATVLKQAAAHLELQKRYPLLTAYLDFSNRAYPDFKTWLRDPNVKASYKADFMMTLIGKGEAVFDDHFHQIQANELNDFWQRMDERTNFQAYYKLAKQKGLLPYVLSVASLETFLYISENMPSPENPKTFTMGSADENNATPHSVTLNRSVQIAAAPEADILWELVMGENPSVFDGSAADFKGSAKMNSSNHPVENISWWSSVVYANKKSEIEGLQPVFDFSDVKFKEGTSAADGTLDAISGEVKINFAANGYRLLTEAEQELMIRAGSQSKYPMGDDESKLPLSAWFDKNSGNRTHKLGELRPNAFGFVDTIGNIGEWGFDWYAPYSAEAMVDPQGPATAANRVLRGGCWFNDADWLQSTYRDGAKPSYRYGFVGFRLGRTPR